MIQPSMDHRGLIEINGKYITVGGMGDNQEVLNQVFIH